MFTSGSAKTITGEASAVVQRPLASVFDFVGHRFFENYPRWNPQVVEFEPLTSGPAKAGDKLRQVTVDHGIRTESTFEIVSFNPPRNIRIKGLSEAYEAQYKFEEQGDDATRVSFQFELPPGQIFMRPFRRVLRDSLQEGAERTVKKLKQALESAYAVETSPESLARFVYVASLDLQEPLRKIEAFSDFLDNAMASSNKSDMAYAQEAMRGYAATARKLVDDLLTYSSTILDGQRLEVIDLKEAIGSVLHELNQVIVATGSHIDVQAAPVAFLADRMQFCCLLRNILTNAIKYRKPGEGAKVQISVALQDETTASLAIVDRGVGFHEEFAQAIFEPFKRMPGRIEYPGTGIELAICKSIADRHGWGISVKSQPGEGAGFYFTVPTLVEDDERMG